jgi:hypothetical protein
VGSAKARQATADKDAKESRKGEARA